MSLVELDVSKSWRERLGWMEKVPTTVLLAQLKQAIKKFDKLVVDSVLATLVDNNLDELLHVELRSYACVLTTAQQYALPKHCFQHYCSRLGPYAWDIDPASWSSHRALFQRLGVGLWPELDDLITIQHNLNSGPVLDESDVAVVLEILKQATKFTNEPLKGLKVLTEANMLCALQDV